MSARELFILELTLALIGWAAYRLATGDVLGYFEILASIVVGAIAERAVGTRRVSDVLEMKADAAEASRERWRQRAEGMELVAKMAQDDLEAAQARHLGCEQAAERRVGELEAQLAARNDVVRTSAAFHRSVTQWGTGSAAYANDEIYLRHALERLAALAGSVSEEDS